MASYGLTTTALTNISAAICSNTPFVIPVNAIQLHTGAPGANATANVSAIGVRQLCTLTLTSGVLTLTGTTPTWYNVSAAENINGISLWTDLTAGYAWMTAPMSVAQTDAIGDTFTIGAISLPLNVGLAS